MTDLELERESLEKKNPINFKFAEGVDFSATCSFKIKMWVYF